MGFAIPLNMARVIADQIVDFGEIRRGTLGFTTEDPTAQQLRDLKLPRGGAVITKIVSGSPGERAGLKAGDVVTEVGDRTVLSSSFLRNRLALLRVGEVAELAVLRGGKQLKIRATVAERDQRARSK
jgi:S1-C subfamily serine protease